MKPLSPRPAPIASASDARPSAASLPPRRLHLLLGVAALSVTAFSLTGVAALTGLLPGPQAAHPAGPLPAAAFAQALPTASAEAVQAVHAQALVAPPATVAEAARAARQAAGPSAVVHAAPVRRPAGRAPIPEAQPAAQPAPVASPVSQAPDAWPPARGVQAAPAGTRPVRLTQASEFGTVESVRAVSEPGASLGLGTIGGGVLGGAIGSQIGKGNGRTAMAALGAIGGGLLGHEVEQRLRAPRGYEVRLRMDDGTLRTVRHARDPGWRVGQRVHADEAVESAGSQPPNQPQPMQVGAPA